MREKFINGFLIQYDMILKQCMETQCLGNKQLCCALVIVAMGENNYLMSIVWIIKREPATSKAVCVNSWLLVGTIHTGRVCSTGHKSWEVKQKQSSKNRNRPLFKSWCFKRFMFFVQNALRVLDVWGLVYLWQQNKVASVLNWVWPLTETRDQSS